MLREVRMLVKLIVIVATFVLCTGVGARPALAAAPPVEVAFSGAPDAVSPGGTLVYKIVIGNPSAATATGNFTVRVDVPQYETAVYAPSGQCNGSCRFGGYLTWAVSSLAPGASAYLQFTATVDNSTTNPPPADGTVLAAQLSTMIGSTTVNATANVLVGTHPIDLVVADSPNRVAPGGKLTYTFTFGNAGASATAGTLRVPLPAGTTFVSATGNGAANGGVVTWDLGSLPAGPGDQRQLTVLVDGAAPAGTLVPVTAEIVDTGSQQSLVRESATSLVAATSPLSLTLQAVPDPVTAGATIVYTLRVANQSPNTPTGAFPLWVNVPQGVAATYAPNGQCNYACRFGGLVSWQVPTLAPGDSTVLQFTGTIDDSTANPPPPNGSVLSLDAVAFVFGGLRQTLASTVDGGNHMSLTVSGAPDRVAPGATLTYTFEAGNAGSTGVATHLDFALPTGVSFVSATGGGTATGTTVDWDLGTVTAGQVDQRQLTVTVDAAAVPGALLLGQGELVAASGGRPLVRASTTNLVNANAFLTMTLSATPSPVEPGSTVIYKINITNTSASTPTGAFPVWVNVPQFMTTTLATGGQCNFTCRFGGLISWQVASLAAGGNTVLQFTATVDNSVANPPPANGTVLEAVATAYVFGGLRADLETLVGPGTGTGGSATDGGTVDAAAGGLDGAIASEAGTADGGPGSGEDASLADGSAGTGADAAIGSGEDDGSAGPGSGSGSGSSGSSGSASGSSSGSSGGGSGDTSKSGCSCHVGPSRSDAGSAALALAGVALVVARRRKRRV